MAKAVGLTQKEIVFEILRSGVEKPSDIVDIAKQKHGVEIGKGNINQIKMAWKKQLVADGQPGKPRARPVVAKSVAVSSGSVTSMSTVDAILDLVELVGVSKARAIIAGLK